MFKKGLAVAVILLFIGMTISSSAGFNLEKQSTIALFEGTTFYVDDDFNESTPGWNVTCFDKIQNAVDVAGDGDTIFVYSGIYTYYGPGNRGCIDIRQKNINLVGEDKYTTILDADGELGVVHVDAEFFRISGFTITNSRWFGIELGFNYVKRVIICDNIISGHDDGIIIWMGKNLIYNNIIRSNNEYGIYINGRNNIFYNNLIMNNSIGMRIVSCRRVIVHNNLIRGNDVGILLENSRVLINKNNIINNSNQATYDILRNLPLGRSIWFNNYWSDWNTSIPRPIKGSWGYYLFVLRILVGPFPSYQFDWHPASEPYDIGV